MGDDDKKGRGRPRKQNIDSEADNEKKIRRKEDDSSKGTKRGRGRPKGSTGKKRKKARLASPKKSSKRAKNLASETANN